MKGKVLGDMFDEVMEAIAEVRDEIEQLRETIAIGDIGVREPPEDAEALLPPGVGMDERMPWSGR